MILGQLRQAKFYAIDLYMVCLCVMLRCERDCYGKPISHSTEHKYYAMVQAAEATTEQIHVMSGEQAVSAVHQRGNRGQQGQQGHKSRDMLKN